MAEITEEIKKLINDQFGKLKTEITNSIKEYNENNNIKFEALETAIEEVHKTAEASIEPSENQQKKVIPPIEVEHKGKTYRAKGNTFRLAGEAGLKKIDLTKMTDNEKTKVLENNPTMFALID